MMEHDQIIEELKTIKTILAKMVGTSDKPVKQQFSKEALDKVATQFKRLAAERGEWLEGCDVHKVIRHASYNPAKFLIDELEFTNYFKRGSKYYFNKKDLQALANELKERDIHLKRYIEYKDDKAKFDKYVERALQKPSKLLPYILPEDLKDISTSSPPRPSVKLIRKHIKALNDEFEQHRLSEYIDVYNGTYAMSKDFYRYKNYLDKDLTKRISKWIYDFNVANELLREFGYKRKPNAEQ